ncbi:MAG TPA: GNAT family N-acetyltransferase [Allosphingosinicella sp.]|nr:GNAT family N-acetyltransferase [Allosphingosinicella sp.]
MPPPLKAAAAFGIGYRVMTDGDLPFVAKLYATTRAEEVAVTGWPPETQAAFLDQQHRAQHAYYRSAYPDGEWLLIERDGAPIGRLYLAEEMGKLLLVDISLLPEARGTGLGTAILTDLLADETRPVELHVERFNPARRLYERFGFVLLEEQPVYLRMIRQPPA